MKSSDHNSDLNLMDFLSIMSYNFPFLFWSNLKKTFFYRLCNIHFVFKSLERLSEFSISLLFAYCQCLEMAECGNRQSEFVACICNRI